MIAAEPSAEEQQKDDNEKNYPHGGLLFGFSSGVIASNKARIAANIMKKTA